MSNEVLLVVYKDYYGYKVLLQLAKMYSYNRNTNNCAFSCLFHSVLTSFLVWYPATG